MTRPARQGIVARFMRWFFAEWRFPALVLFVLVAYELMMLGMLLVPEGEGELAAFARDFKVWCFGYDPDTGVFQPMYLLMMLTEPAALAGTILLVWWKPLKAVARTPGSLVPWAVGAAAFMTIAAVGLGVVGWSSPDDPTVFPSERLRTAHAPPQFQLVDQAGDVVDLERFQGQVVVLTAVYATCSLTCPMILGQAKRVVEKLPPELRRDLTVVGVTLDPENDDPERLAGMAEGQGVHWPEFRLVNGAPDEVNRTLDQLGVARKTDSETGVIDHVNLFVLVDRAGKVAYRFTLGEQQEAWMEEALVLLLREGRPTG